jgi:hypothetical protein
MFGTEIVESHLSFGIYDNISALLPNPNRVLAFGIAVATQSFARRSKGDVMPEPKQFTVRGDNGLRGTMFATARFLDDNSERLVRLEDGRELRVPADALDPQPDGSFYLRLAPSDIPGTRNSATTQNNDAARPAEPG